jgi:8-oxo-dGTP diphosphatase
MNRFNNVIFGQKAFILNEKNEILVIKRLKVDIFQDMWDVPGGKLEEGEDLLQAITREVKEECGLELTRIILVLSTSKIQGSMGDNPIIFRNIYLAQAQGTVKLSKEHSEYRWVPLAELGAMNFPPDADFQAAILKIPEIVSLLDTQKKYSLLF